MKNAALPCFVACVALAACSRSSVDTHHTNVNVTRDPSAADEAHAAVLANADRVTIDALELWSRAVPPMTADALPETVWDHPPYAGAADGEPVGTTTITGAEIPVAPDVPPSQPVPTAPPRSAAEAAERGDPTTGPLAPTAPAETSDPFR